MSNDGVSIQVNSLADHERLIAALLVGRSRWQRPKDPRRIDTHISTVLLLGDKAYKIKKPIELGFLDFSTLERRRDCCREEVRLNRRLAPQIYQDAIPITGAIDKPVLDGKGEPIDWAVRMRRFDPDINLATRGEMLGRGMIERIAHRIAEFHGHAAVSWEGSRYGKEDTVRGPIAQTFAQIRQHAPGVMVRELVELAAWFEDRFDTLSSVFQDRKNLGRIRECHGDLHLGNITLINGEPLIFDGIEFSTDLRWIDVINDLAFLTMDLTFVGRVDLARWLLSTYLEATGDYHGLRLLHFYEVYRALVRAKVHAIRAEQPDLDVGERNQARSEVLHYIRVADALAKPGYRAIIITHGLSGSGKSTLSSQLLGHLPAIRVRSDVERKRLAGLQAEQRVTGLFNAGLYSQDMTTRTYERLAELATDIVAAGFIAVVDATFLKAASRRRFADLANELSVPFVILSCDPPEQLVRERVKQRQEAGIGPSDADLQVVEGQLKAREPLSADERAWTVQVQYGESLELDDIIQRLL